MKKRSYDLIGDVHGQAPELIRLLEKLSYKQVDGVWQHVDRKVVFLGDFIDRGIHQKAVIDIVQPMVEQGYAISVMGNHEYNAIAYSTKNTNGEYLRSHSSKNTKQHKAFINAYKNDVVKYKAVVEWFKTLPLWLDIDGFRAVHACWDANSIKLIKESQDGSNLLSDNLLCESSKKGTWQHNTIEILLKGKKIALPNGFGFNDADGNFRKDIRIKWWGKSMRTYQDYFIGSDDIKASLPIENISSACLVNYDSGEKPLFIGHYWLNDTTTQLASNIACVEYSAANEDGKLVEYQWDGEKCVIDDNFVSVARI